MDDTVPAAERPGAPPRDLRRSHAVAAVALALAVFFAPALLGPAVFAYRDTGRMHAPTKQWIGEELRAGRFPQWNPYAGLGVPVIANAIDSPQHPFNLLLVALPGDRALTAWILASFAMAAAGAWAWARQLGASTAAASLAALAYALSGPLVSSSDNVTYLTAYAALPGYFAALHRFGARGGPRALALVALASALLAAAGDPQSWGLAAGLSSAYALAVAERGRRRGWLRRGLLAAGASLLAAAPFVLPVVAWLPEAFRTGGLPANEATKWNTHPIRFLELFLPDLFRGAPGDPIAPAFAAFAGNDVTPIPWFLSLYLGASVLGLAVLGALRDPRARRMGVAALAIVWAAAGHHLGFGELAARLPILGAFRYWEKVTVFLPLLAAPLAALGLDALRAGHGRRGLARWAGGAALLLLATAGLLALASLAGGRGSISAAASELAANALSGTTRAGVILALVSVLAWRTGRGRLGDLAPLGVWAVAALDLFGGNVGAYVLERPSPTDRPPLARALGTSARVLSPFTGREDRWPELDRVENTWEWSRRTLMASWNVPLRLGSARDYVGLRQARWARFREEIGDGERLSRMGRFGFTHVVVPGSPGLAVRAGLTPPFRIVAEDAELPAWLLELPHRPRAYLAGELRSAGAKEALESAVRDASGSVVEGPVPEGYAPPDGEARVVRDDPGLTEIEAHTSSRALLVLNDAYAPGWTAKVDGTPARIHRVDGLVRGVWVDAGSHRIRFAYRTPGLALGWALAAALAAGIAAWALLRRGPRADFTPPGAAP